MNNLVYVRLSHKECFEEILNNAGIEYTLLNARVYIEDVIRYDANIPDAEKMLLVIKLGRENILF